MALLPTSIRRIVYTPQSSWVFAVMLTWELAVSVPSLTVNCAVYAPGWSAMNAGLAIVESESVAELLGGLATSFQLNVSVSPSGSFDLLPSSFTVEPVVTV